MSVTSTAPAPAAVRDPSTRATDPTSPIDAGRAFGVMLGMLLDIQRRAERAA